MNCKSAAEVQYKLEVYLAQGLISQMVEEVSNIGACRIGNYDHVASYYEIEGCWRPLEDAKPVTGEKQRMNYGREYKLELRCRQSIVQSVIDKIKEIHPYEEVLINIIRLENHLFEV